MKEYRFHKKENPLPLAAIKDSFKNGFQWKRYLRYLHKLFFISQKVVFTSHYKRFAGK